MKKKLCGTDTIHVLSEPIMETVPYTLYMQQQDLVNKALSQVERLVKENEMMSERVRHIKEFCQANISAYDREHLGRFGKPLNKIVYMCQDCLNKLATYKNPKANSNGQKNI